MRCAKQFFSRAEKRNEQRNLQGIHKIIHDLNRRQIQTPEECHERTKRRRRPEHREHSQRHAERHGADERPAQRRHLLQMLENQRRVDPGAEMTLSASSPARPPRAGPDGLANVPR